MDQPLQALDLVREIAPFLLSHADMSNQGYCYYILSLCYLAQEAPDFDQAEVFLAKAIHCRPFLDCQSSDPTLYV